MTVVEGIVESERVADDVCEEKLAENGKISLVVAFVVVIFEFFPFLRTAGDCDMAA